MRSMVKILFENILLYNLINPLDPGQEDERSRRI